MPVNESSEGKEKRKYKTCIYHHGKSTVTVTFAKAAKRQRAEYIEGRDEIELKVLFEAHFLHVAYCNMIDHNSITSISNTRGNRQEKKKKKEWGKLFSVTEHTVLP